MARVAVQVNNRRYEVACDDGQEGHVKELGDFLDRRVRELAASIGAVGENRLLVMAGLVLADELQEMRRRLDSVAAEEGDDGAAEALDQVAERLERIAARLEAS
jgi:cell division protein ZapA